MREKHCQLEEFIKNVLRELLISFGLYIVSELELTRRCNGFLSLFAFFEMTSFIPLHVSLEFLMFSSK